MAEFIPKIINGEFILLDNVFSHEECIEYAKKHKFNIKFVCGTYTCATEILCKIQEAGYSLKFYRKTQCMDGRPLYDNFEVNCYLEEE